MMNNTDMTKSRYRIKVDSTHRLLSLTYMRIKQRNACGLMEGTSKAHTRTVYKLQASTKRIIKKSAFNDVTKPERMCERKREGGGGGGFCYVQFIVNIISVLPAMFNGVVQFVSLKIYERPRDARASRGCAASSIYGKECRNGE